jgi:lipopolysaccharide export system ATP-binding protein
MKSGLRAAGISRSYGGRVVLHPLDLAVKAGEIVGLLGPNGAGKSTAMGMIAGHVVPDTGTVHINEMCLDGWPLWRRVRSGLGFLAQEPAVLRDLSVLDNISIAAETHSIEKNVVEEHLHRMGLTTLAHARAGTLSGGERRRLEIARCLVGSPRFILMDEPFAGVDPLGIEQLQDSVRSLSSQGIGLLITDHAVQATLGVCDRVLILDQGKVMLAGCPEEIVDNTEVRERYLGSRFILENDGVGG